MNASGAVIEANPPRFNIALWFSLSIAEQPREEQESLLDFGWENARARLLDYIERGEWRELVPEEARGPE